MFKIQNPKKDIRIIKIQGVCELYRWFIIVLIGIERFISLYMLHSVMSADPFQRKRVNEVGFANYSKEFGRFYYNHRSFCDEVSGLKERIVKENGGESRVSIIPDNFIMGITKLNAFVVDNLHYIINYEERKLLMDSVLDLENRFNNDTEYFKLTRVKVRSIEQEQKLQGLYFKYLTESFQIASKLMNLLQTSLMISTNAIRSQIIYREDSDFYFHLNNYRDSVSDSIANFDMKTCIPRFKAIVSFYWTYCIFIELEERNEFERVIKLTSDYILSKEVFNLIVLCNKQDRLSNDYEVKRRNTASFIRTILQRIYTSVNTGLMEKKIYTKPQVQVHIDKTGI